MTFDQAQFGHGSKQINALETEVFHRMYPTLGCRWRFSRPDWHIPCPVALVAQLAASVLGRWLPFAVAGSELGRSRSGSEAIPHKSRALLAEKVNHLNNLRHAYPLNGKASKYAQPMGLDGIHFSIGLSTFV